MDYWEITFAITLCQTTTGFDARSRKIQRVAQPETDTDADNKRYVDKLLRARQGGIEQKMIALETNVQALRIMMDEIKNVLRYTSNSAQ